jgi:hypothetical protein
MLADNAGPAIGMDFDILNGQLRQAYSSQS